MKTSIYPCLWFDGNANEAANFYCSVFNNSVITSENAIVVAFELNGQRFMGLNGGPKFTPNPSVSIFTVCETLDEVETIWQRLLDGGTELMPLDKYDWSEKYGWVQDRFGVSWQLSFGKMQDVGQKFTPTLMFTQNQAGKAEDAIKFYTSVFPDSSITGILKYTAQDNDVEGTVKHAQFKLGDNVFMAMDSSIEHPFGFNEAISFVVECANQQEIDYYWNNLSLGGAESMCGWLEDKYGVSWQIVPSILGKLMGDQAKAPRVMNAILEMKKLDIEQLTQAYERG